MKSETMRNVWQPLSSSEPCLSIWTKLPLPLAECLFTFRGRICKVEDWTKSQICEFPNLIKLHQKLHGFFTDSSRSGYSWVSIIPSKSDLSKGKSLQQAMTSIFPVRPSYITFVCWCILISSKSSPIFEAHLKPRTGHHPSSVKPPKDKRIPYIQCLLVRGFIGWFVHGTCFFSCHCNV